MYKPKDRSEIYRNMSAIRSTGNRSETELGRRLHRMGLRYRKYSSGLPGKPDFVFSGAKVVVFVDGDYWHGRVLVEQGLNALEARIKTPNREYWIAKFQRNVERDKLVTKELQAEGWRVIRLWESDVKRDVQRMAENVAIAVRSRKPTSPA